MDGAVLDAVAEEVAAGDGADFFSDDSVVFD